MKDTYTQPNLKTREFEKEAPHIFCPTLSSYVQEPDANAGQKMWDKDDAAKNRFKN